MVIELRVRVQPYLGLGQEGHMRVAALRRIASEAGFMRNGVPSVSRWLQHLADEKISEVGSGYYAVQIEKDDEQSLVFLARRPPGYRGAKIVVVEGESGSEVCGRGHYLKLVDEDGARDMLRDYGMEIADSEPVPRETLLALLAVEVAGEDLDDVPGWNGKVVRTRLREVLAEINARDERGWTCIHMSREAGIHPGTIYKYAGNKVTKYSLETLDKLCKFLGCRVGELVVLEEREEAL